MKKVIGALVLVFTATLLQPATFADEGAGTGTTSASSCGLTSSPWTQETTYGGKVTGKLDFGIKNVLGGWTQMITQPKKFHKEGKCACQGLGKGIGYFIVDTVGGALHLVTFPIPFDIPLPEGGVDLS